jgi:hypothetical protein
VLPRALAVVGLASVATVSAVSAGTGMPGGDEPTAAELTTSATGAARPAALADASVADRTVPVSRSDRRLPLDPARAAVLDQRPGGQASRVVRRPAPKPKPAPAPAPAPAPTGDPRSIAKALLPQYGFAESQFTCLDPLWQGESGWDLHATNPSSGAYGIPQALPGSKMATAGADWQNNAETQIKWGLDYIRGRYGTPCGAWSFKQANGWY